MNKNMSYTPATTDGHYMIPIYQRLFEWDTDNINTLLNDLKKAYLSKERNYYIGMLTAKKENDNVIVLVDGQQRFVVMMLMACVLRRYYKEWGNFLLCDGKRRLRFASRPKDEVDLEYLMNEGKPTEGCNLMMKNGFVVIAKFMEGLKDGDDEVSKEDFSLYVYKHLRYFVSYLPDEYDGDDLNKYFERMNTTGKDLEQHEILKVKLLRHFGDRCGVYMQIWNKIADVDVPLIRKKTDKESEQNLSERKNRAICENLQVIIDEDLINDIKGEESEECQCVISISPNCDKPSPNVVHSLDTRFALTFSQLLLQVLYWFLKDREEKIQVSIDNFFSTSNLLEIFDTHLPYDGDRVDKNKIIDFFEKLVKCKLVMDTCFISLKENGYGIDMFSPEERFVEGDDESEEESGEELKKLMMYESMLYVSSSNTSNYKWFGWLMDFVLNKRKRIPSAEELCNYLKTKDNKVCGKCPPYEKLSYGNDIRYWFWRLDYYLWENRKDIFEGESLKVANNYVFRRNRSIEHIAPQTPMQNATLRWKDEDEDEFDSNEETRVRESLWSIPWDDLRYSLNEEKEKIADRIIRHSFGNLAMISKGLNSSLQNMTYEEKMAHVKSHCKGEYRGSIESLNLLWIYKIYDSWTNDTFRKNIIEHGRLMRRFLEASFDKKEMQRIIGEIGNGSE